MNSYQEEDPLRSVRKNDNLLGHYHLEPQPSYQRREFTRIFPESTEEELADFSAFFENIPENQRNKIFEARLAKAKGQLYFQCRNGHISCTKEHLGEALRQECIREAHNLQKSLERFKESITYRTLTIEVAKKYVELVELRIRIFSTMEFIIGRGFSIRITPPAGSDMEDGWREVTCEWMERVSSVGYSYFGDLIYTLQNVGDYLVSGYFDTGHTQRDYIREDLLSHFPRDLQCLIFHLKEWSDRARSKSFRAIGIGRIRFAFIVTADACPVEKNIETISPNPGSKMTINFEMPRYLTRSVSS